MNSKKIQKYKQTLKLSDIQREIIVGKLLGDGHLESRDGIMWRLKIEHSIKQQEYVDWLYQKFRKWVLSEPLVKNKAVREKSYQNIGFSTVSHIKLRYYGNIFYKEGKKIIPKNIKTLLSPLSMAVWFMDDGSNKSKHHKSLILNTQSFEKKDLLFLQSKMIEKFAVNCSLRKQKEGYQIEIKAHDAQKFAKIICKHILPSMMYKLEVVGLTNLPKL